MNFRGPGGLIFGDVEMFMMFLGDLYGNPPKNMPDNSRPKNFKSLRK